MKPIPSDVLAALREATVQRHAQLDHAMPLAVPAPTLEHYHRHLQLLQAWLAPMHRWQSAFTDGPQDPALWQADDALDRIAADLRHSDVAALARQCRWPWPPQAGAAYRWGVAYVTEGSRLGGAVLHRRLAAHLAPLPLHYLGAPPPGPRWQRFLAALRSATATPEQRLEACAGARDAFDALLALLRAAGNPVQAAA